MNLSYIIYISIHSNLRLQHTSNHKIKQLHKSSSLTITKFLKYNTSVSWRKKHVDYKYCLLCFFCTERASNWLIELFPIHFIMDPSSSRGLSILVVIDGPHFWCCIHSSSGKSKLIILLFFFSPTWSTYTLGVATKFLMNICMALEKRK